MFLRVYIIDLGASIVYIIDLGAYIVYIIGLGASIVYIIDLSASIVHIIGLGASTGVHYWSERFCSIHYWSGWFYGCTLLVWVLLRVYIIDLGASTGILLIWVLLRVYIIDLGGYTGIHYWSGCFYGYTLSIEFEADNRTLILWHCRESNLRSLHFSQAPLLLALLPIGINPIISMGIKSKSIGFVNTKIKISNPMS